MKWLVDTNIVSELYKPSPHERVFEWFHECETRLALSVLTIGELRNGIELLPPGQRRTTLDRQLELDLIPSFSRRILTVDLRVAQSWGELCARARRPLPVLDSLLAATALARNLILATRNTRDFAGTGVKLFNPWTDL